MTIEGRLDTRAGPAGPGAATLDDAAPALSRGLTLLFSVACGLAVANAYYAQPLLDAMADDFGIGRAVIGLVMTTTQVGYGLGLLLVVPLGDILDRRRLIVSQSLLASAALLGVACARSEAVMLVAMAAVGMLAVVTQVLVAYAGTLAAPTERGRAVGIVTSGVIIGIMLVRSVSGTLADLFGWRSVYLVSAAATLIVAILLFRSLPRRHAAGGQVPYFRLIGSVFTLYLEEPILRVRATLALLIFAAVNTLWTPMVLPLSAPPLSLSHTEVGLFGFAGAMGAVGAATAGRFADRGYAQRTTGIALAIMLVAWLPIAVLPHSILGLIVGVVMIDFGLQAVHVSNQSLIFRVRPEARSRLTGAYMIFYSIGCGAGAIASTLVYAHAGWSGVCLLGAAISAAAIVFWIMTRNMTPELEKPEQLSVPQTLTSRPAKGSGGH